MDTIATVTGARPVTELGLTLVHEHLRLRWSEADRQFPTLTSRQNDFATALARVETAKKSGVQTICDPAVMGIGRDVEFLRDIAIASGMNIIAATGVYTLDHLAPALGRLSTDQLADLFVADLTDGVQGTPIRAAFLKCATDTPGMTPDVERSLRAVARAHLRTGAPIMTHSHAPSKVGRLQQEVFESEGVDLTRVMIGHSGDTTDLDYLTSLTERGSFLGMDRFGLEDLLPNDDRISTIVRLVEMGLGPHILLSQDYVCVNERKPPEDLAELRAKWSLNYVVDEVVPALSAAGLDENSVRAMVSTNAWAWLSGSAPTEAFAPTPG